MQRAGILEPALQLPTVFSAELRHACPKAHQIDGARACRGLVTCTAPALNQRSSRGHGGDVYGGKEGHPAGDHYCNVSQTRMSRLGYRDVSRDVGTDHIYAGTRPVHNVAVSLVMLSGRIACATVSTRCDTSVSRWVIMISMMLFVIPA
jgi:hypothetical protein